MEPSALAGLACLVHPKTEKFLRQFSAKQLKTSSHLVWGTGGALVPQHEMASYYQQGKEILDNKNLFKKLFPQGTV